MLDTTYNPNQIEEEIYPRWESSGVFSPKLDGSKPTYTIMMPPPNVTGSLHIGHALNHTLQDILVRYHRMKGFDVLWQPGTDHAGIATQIVVERQMDQEKISRLDLGREKFIERVWKWKEQSGGTIVQQLRRLGVSPDWSRERFTMDEGLSKAVRQIFVDLYKSGLIYRDKRLVQWDPKLLTAISDLEVENIETQGTLWHFKYPIEGSDAFITVATTRPETMFGDVAVAVHPEDARYQHLIGKQVRLPLANRLIPIIADEHSDPEKGTGAVKITPAHDFNDFEVGKRHNLEPINILDQHAHLNENVPEAYRGMERFKARKKVTADMQELGFFVGEEATVHAVPHAERTGTVTEPWLTDQWFVDAKTLAQPAIKAVEEGRTKFAPANWTKTYFEWLRNIQPWCISRQIWWGHRIPAWYGPDGHIFVSHNEEEALAEAREHYGKETELMQDTDVLDTWFSSALWPFSTLGWPDKTNELEKCYPGDVLVTGHDIIFFWVARMMMMGLHYMGDVPFHTVYITALVRDEKGQKMSKSKGNVVDPLESIDQFGADAIRFSLAALAGPGRNVNFSKSQVEGYRNFATKLWNAFRFCQNNECIYNSSFNPDTVQLTLNKWIVGEVYTLGNQLAQHLEDFRFDEACLSLYHFVWGTFCDRYLEFSKPLMNGSDAEIIKETQDTTAWVLKQIIQLLHPFMPFITEHLWKHHIGEGQLITAPWPDYASIEIKKPANPEATQEIEWLINLVTAIRGARAEANIPAGARLPLFSSADMSKKAKESLQNYAELLQKMARLSQINVNDPAPEKGILQVIVNGESYSLHVGDVIDIEAECHRLRSALDELDKEVFSLSKKLDNKDFVAKAPRDVVEKNENRRAEALRQKEKIENVLSNLER
jgi:valyl-tRNA synthetase